MPLFLDARQGMGGVYAEAPQRSEDEKSVTALAVTIPSLPDVFLPIVSDEEAGWSETKGRKSETANRLCPFAAAKRKRSFNDSACTRTSPTYPTA